MEAFILLSLLSGLAWGVIYLRHASLVQQTFVVILTGSVFGHAFYNYPLGPFPVTADRILLALVGLQFLFVVVKRHELRLRLLPLDFAILALFVCLTASTLTHDFRYKDYMPLGRLLFLNWLPIVAYLIVRFSEVKRGDIPFLLGGLILFGTYLSATAIAEVGEIYSLVFPSYIYSPEHTEFLGRARGPFLNPIATGIYQIVCLAAWATAAPHLMKLDAPRRCLVGIPFLALGLLFLLGIVCTLTRSVWLAAAGAMFLLVWLPLQWKSRLILTLATSVLAMSTLVVFADRLDSFKRDKNVTAHEMGESLKLRPLLTTVAFRMFADRPIFGVGFGQYTQYKRPYHHGQTTEQPLRKVLPYMQHNLFLSYLTETGLVGLSILLTVIGGIAIQTRKLWLHPCCVPHARTVAVLMMVMLWAHLINGCFHDTSLVPMTGMLLFFFAGLTANLSCQLAIQPDSGGPAAPLPVWQCLVFGRNTPMAAATAAPHASSDR